VTTGEGRLETLALLRTYVAEGDVPVPLINWMRHVEWEIARLAEAADQMTEIAERAEPSGTVAIHLSRATVMRLRLAMLDRPQDEDWSGEVRQACAEVV
jgi:hypothetical protein